MHSDTRRFPQAHEPKTKTHTHTEELIWIHRYIPLELRHGGNNMSIHIQAYACMCMHACVPNTSAYIHVHACMCLSYDTWETYAVLSSHVSYFPSALHCTWATGADMDSRLHIYAGSWQSACSSVVTRKQYSRQLSGTWASTITGDAYSWDRPGRLR